MQRAPQVVQVTVVMLAVTVWLAVFVPPVVLVGQPETPVVVQVLRL